MDPIIFKPFKVIEYSKMYLHLAEPKLRKSFLFFFFRLYPLLIFAGIAATLIAFNFPLEIQLLFGGMGLTILLLFIFKNFVEEVKISNLDITVTYHTFFGRKIKTILISEVDKITVETMIFSTIGGYYYRVKLKESKKDFEIFTIPRWYINRKNKAEINKILEEITSLEVVKW